MTIRFEIHEKELWCCYSPETGIGYIREKLSENENVVIKYAFTVNKDLLREEIDEGFEEIKFCIGELAGEYIRLFPDVIGTKHDFYFHREVRFNIRMFIANRGISILRKIDAIIDRDFYVGGDWEKYRGISRIAYNELIDRFPKTAELDKYANYRIGSILKEYYPECDRYEQIYDKYIRKRNQSSKDKTKKTTNFNQRIELEQFNLAYQELAGMLNDSGIDEETWQHKIYGILRLLYPQYVYCIREIQFPVLGNRGKRPDFLLVDVNGYVDILEIKKADVYLLSQYRNNYVPSREFTGAIQQIEKYTFCLNTLPAAKEKVCSAISRYVPKGFPVRILNPQGMLLLGRSDRFNKQQQEDFELIKRQYKHIVDIMTYDDLLSRLKNIITALNHTIEYEHHIRTPDS